MKPIFEISKNDILKKQKIWFYSFLVSLFLYLLLTILFLFIHTRSNSVIFLIITFLLTVVESSFSLYYLLYKRKRIKQYFKLVSNKKNLNKNKFVFIKENDNVLKDFLPFRQIDMKDVLSNQIYSFFLLSTFIDALTENQTYEIIYDGRIIYGLEEYNNEK